MALSQSIFTKYISGNQYRVRFSEDIKSTSHLTGISVNVSNDISALNETLAPMSASFGNDVYQITNDFDDFNEYGKIRFFLEGTPGDDFVAMSNTTNHQDFKFYWELGNGSDTVIVDQSAELTLSFHEGFTSNQGTSSEYIDGISIDSPNST